MKVRRWGKWWVVGCVMMVLALVMAGCGGGGDASAPSANGATGSSENSGSEHENPGGEKQEGSSAEPVQLMIPTMAAGTWPYVSTETLVPYYESVLPKGSRIERAAISTGDLNGLYLLKAGQGDLYIVSDLPAHWVWEGRQLPGIEGQYQDFRKILQVEAIEGLGMFVAKELVDQYNLKTVDDLFASGAKLTMATFPAGTTANVMAEQVLTGYGFANFDDFKAKGHTVLTGSPQDQVKYVRDRQANVQFGMIVGFDFPMTEEMTSSVDMVLLPFGEAKMKEIMEKYGFTPWVIPADAYKGVAEDTEVFGLGGYIVVRADMPEEVAYQLTKVMYENWDEIRAKDAFFKLADVHYRETPIPWHPGAERLYKEVGKLK